MRYRTHRFAIRATLVFRVKFNMEFPRHMINFPLEICASLSVRLADTEIQSLFFW